MNFKVKIREFGRTLNNNKGLILTICAGVLEIGAIIATAKQAPKAEKILKPVNDRIEKLTNEMKDSELVDNHKVYPEDNKKEIKKLQRQTFLKLAKVYSVPVVLALASLTCLGTSYKFMKNRQIAIGAAYMTLENAFKGYRNRVKEAVGEEKEQEIFRDIKDTIIKKQVVDENGEVKEVEEIVRRAQSGGAWELWFDAGSLKWSNNGRTNYETLMNLQKEANITLKINHSLFLWDIIQMLDIPLTTIPKDLLIASRYVGWIYDPYDPDRSSWVSFGISDELGNYNEVGKELFLNNEKDVMLSFNCDGNITFGDKKSFAYYVTDYMSN